MKLSLKYRIALIIFLLEAIMMGTVLWYTLGLSLENTQQQLTANENTLLEVISEIGRVALLTEEYADFQPYLEKTLDNHRVGTALLIDANNTIVASADPILVGKQAPPLTTQSNRIWRHNTLSNAAGKLGTIAIEFSNDALLAAYAETRALGLTIALTGMVFIALIGLGAGIMLTRRLEMLQGAARAVAQGKTPHPLKVRGNDELSELASAFNQMLEDLQEERARTQAAQQRLEQRVTERTRDLAAANQELEAFSYSVSHDLRAPLRAIDGFSQALLEDYAPNFDNTGEDYLNRIRNGAQRMGTLIDDMLSLSRISRHDLKLSQVDISKMACEIIAGLQAQEPDRKIRIVVAPDMWAFGDPSLLHIALSNLLGNAWKYTANTTSAQITFQPADSSPPLQAFCIQDNGAGFDMQYANKLFSPFQRLHTQDEFPGNGIGLATAQRILHRHGGHIRAEGHVGQGATFFIELKAATTSAEHLPIEDEKPNGK